MIESAALTQPDLLAEIWNRRACTWGPFPSRELPSLVITEESAKQFEVIETVMVLYKASLQNFDLIGKWQARLCVNSTQRNLGCSFKTPEDAARVWDAAAILHFGTGINPQMLNFPDE